MLLLDTTWSISRHLVKFRAPPSHWLLAQMLYLFLVLVADRKGLSYYSYDKICTLLRLSLNEYIYARDALIQKDLIAFDGHLYQVLCLPQNPIVQRASPLKTQKDMVQRDPATIRQLIVNSIGGDHD